MVFAGGSWTNKKLKALHRYLTAYAVLMKDKPRPEKPFRKIYFDAFCGSGTRNSEEPTLFGSEELQNFAEFSPRVALSIAPQFDNFVFCDAKAANVDRLKKRLESEGLDMGRCRFAVGDANAEVTTFCRSTNWRETRSVMFLDPFGLQVNWATLEEIARTQAIDLWYLFPSGLGPLRMTPRSGDVPADWATRLTTIWGDQSWREVAYSEETTKDLFGQADPKISKTGDVGAFERAFMERLRTIFPGVSRSALRLRNSVGFEMFSLIFACANPRDAAKKPALNIANHIVEMRD